jgi:phage terminase small subunit
VSDQPVSPPRHLSAEAKRRWRELADQHHVERDPAALLTLRAAMEALDRMEVARKDIAKRGSSVATGAGGVKTNPSVAIERDSRRAMVSCLSELSAHDMRFRASQADVDELNAIARGV